VSVLKNEKNKGVRIHTVTKNYLSTKYHVKMYSISAEEDQLEFKTKRKTDRKYHGTDRAED